jgi:hypothetical protein
MYCSLNCPPCAKRGTMLKRIAFELVFWGFCAFIAWCIVYTLSVRAPWDWDLSRP